MTTQFSLAMKVSKYKLFNDQFVFN